jgi:hypothetical protein
MMNPFIKFSAMLLLSSVAFFSAKSQSEVLNNGATPFWRTAGNNGISTINFLGAINNSSLRIRTNNLQRMVVDSTGNVGIGIGDPATRLHVAGGFRLVNGSQANNFILFSDVNGLSTWKPADSVLSNATTKAWNTVGNAGTNATTNFIGTTDAIDFVVKTSGSASTNERLRVIGNGATPGQVVINNRANFAGDVFSVYSNNTTNGTTTSINNAVGGFAVNGYTDGFGIGVYGESYSTTTSQGIGVWGAVIANNTPASNQSDGVYAENYASPLGTGATAAVSSGVTGVAFGTPGNATTVGAFGINVANSGNAYGVYGFSQSPAGLGVFANNVSTAASPSHGVQGQTVGTALAAGVRGFNGAAAIGNGQSGFGVRGTVAVAPTGTGFVAGVRGDATGTSGNTFGVYGSSVSAAGYGIYGTSTNGVGSFGVSASATSFGLYGANSNASGTALFSVGNNVIGTYLVGGSGAALNGSTLGTLSLATTAATGVGLIGIGNNLTGSIISPAVGCGVSGVGAQYGVVGYATSNVATNPANNAPANGANASAGGYFEVQNGGGTSQTWAYVGVREAAGAGGLRKIIGPGTVNTIVKDLSGELVALSCPETPENLFQDFGTGYLVNGKAHISLDPVFAKNIVVDKSHPLRVFVQLEGDCKGVFVSNKTQYGFDVTELSNGSSATAFSYYVSANRADEVNADGSISRYSQERFAKAPGPLKNVTHSSKTSEHKPLYYTDNEQPIVSPDVVSKVRDRKRK